MLLLERQDRGLHRRPGRQPIVDEHDGAIANWRTASRAAVERVATFQLNPFAHRDLFDERPRNPQIANQITTEDLNPSLGDGAHRQLRMPGNAELADEEHVERRPET